MLDDFFTDILNRNQAAWREVVALGVTNGSSDPGLQRLAQLLRQLSFRSAPREPDPGAA